MSQNEAKTQESPAVEKLLVLDIDNTVFDWVSYYVNSINALFKKVSAITGTDIATLANEAKEVFSRHNSIEHPFLIQEMPHIRKFYGKDINKMLAEAVELGRQAFNTEAKKHLKTYPNVLATLTEIKQRYPKLALVALTDAPRYVAMWKLNKLGILHCFDALYGLPDPKIPTDSETKQVLVDQEILLKHLQKVDFNFTGRIRSLPDDYEKPGTKGLKTVLMDFELENHPKDILWVGDNLRKDVELGKTLGIHTAWAEYGTRISEETKQKLLAFSPERNVHRNAAMDPQSATSPKPDITLSNFSEIIDHLARIWN